MSPRKINLAIAEHLGWRFKGDPAFDSYIKARGIAVDECLAAPPGADYEKKGRYGSYFGPLVTKVHIPNYHGDLNAMHAAEMWLNADDPHAYGCYCSNLYEHYGCTVTLTAAIRAEFFLCTVGKWKEAA